uniref:Putative secreted protein n=1 Tax=Anopheles marajoara TaxID=58244 RepID=A0A2M4CAA8_9DIPT
MWPSLSLSLVLSFSLGGTLRHPVPGTGTMIVGVGVVTKGLIVSRSSSSPVRLFHRHICRCEFSRWLVEQKREAKKKIVTVRSNKKRNQT